MPALDVFKADGFSMESLTEAINLAPFKPRLLGALNVFSTVPVRTTSVDVEERDGTLSLIQTAARGSIADVRVAPQRNIRSFKIPHVPYFQTIRADDVQNIRAFGSETELMSLSAHVNDQLIGMRDDHEVTHEWHRLGALKGQILDADASTTIYDLYTEFGMTDRSTDQTVITYDISSDTIDANCAACIRATADALGNSMFGQIVVLCGNTVFDSLRGSAKVIAGYDRWKEGLLLRTSQLGPDYYALAANGFEYANIWFVNYRGNIGGTAFIAANEGYSFPMGVDGMFQAITGPADFAETVNTRGQTLYARQELMPFNKGIELHTQSNVLMMNTRPKAVCKWVTQA
jgi:hypothetical protein